MWAGKHGHGVMAIPMGGSKLRDLLAAYRDAWRSSGHPGRGTVMLAFHMLCHEDAVEAVRIAREPLNRYLRSLVDAASDWTGDARSESYPGYDKIIAGARRADLRDAGGKPLGVGGLTGRDRRADPRLCR